MNSNIWNVENLRLTAFPSPSASLDDPSWWDTVVGAPPDTRMSQPKAGVLLEQGQFQNGNLSLTIRPGRIDWLLSALEPGGITGPFEEGLDSFASLMQVWLKIAPPLQRIAFGAGLHFAVKDKVEGYNLLSTFLTYVKLDPAGSSEFTYQINRPRASSTDVENLTINRLSKWAVGVTQKATYTFVAGLTTHPQMGDIEQEFHTRLDLDINTSPDFKDDLPADKLDRIFEELISLAKEITEKGDTP